MSYTVVLAEVQGGDTVYQDTVTSLYTGGHIQYNGTITTRLNSGGHDVVVYLETGKYTINSKHLRTILFLEGQCMFR